MTFRDPYSAHSTRQILSFGDIEGIEAALEDIRAEWEQRHHGCAPDYRDLIDVALRRMRFDLDARSDEVVGEVMEDLRREIGYRQWCARAGSAAAV